MVRILTLIISQLNLLLSLVNDVLDLKMIQHGQFTAKFEHFNPAEILDFILAMFKPQAGMQGTQLGYETVSVADLDQAIDNGHAESLLPRHRLPDKLNGDQNRLKQILINLVKNALKFCHRGRVRVVVAYDSDADMLKVHVVDNGKGICKDDIEKLFTMFGKLLRTANINSDGIGMGLMICQNLVTKNGGTISVHSLGEDQGSTFAFTMKMERVLADDVSNDTALLRGEQKDKLESELALEKEFNDGESSFESLLASER